MTELPTISIITLTYNCQRNLAECYQRIRQQDYPQERIELIMCDGGSSDGTRAVGEKYKARFLDFGGKINGEKRLYLGMKEAKHEIFAYIMSDNFMVGPDWLKKMVQPFIDDPGIIATTPAHYHYDKNKSLLDKYFSLLGIGDPVVFFFGKSDKLSWLDKTWQKKKDIISQKPNYTIVEFTQDTLPTVGLNGFLARKSMYQNIDCDPNAFFHIDINYDLVAKGFNRYAIVDITLVHVWGDDLWAALKKRLRYMSIFYQDMIVLRRYKIFDSAKIKDLGKLALYVLYSLTIVGPLYFSFKGFLKKKDLAWFMHPIVCLGFLFVYGYGTIRNLISKKRRQV